MARFTKAYTTNDDGAYMSERMVIHLRRRFNRTLRHIAFASFTVACRG